MSKAAGKANKTRSSTKVPNKLSLSHKIKPIFALPIIAVIVLVGGFFIYRSFAATNPPVCASGTRSIGYDLGFKDGKGYKIRLCKIDGFRSTGSEDGGAVRVSSTSSAKWLQLYNSAKKAGITLVADASFRSYKKQSELYNCYKSGSCKNPTAPAGYSNHQAGTAIDIDIVPGANNDPSLTECLNNSSKYPVYKWLSQNAYKFNRYARVAKECWHWSDTGK